jgi:hypothetical protein
MEAQGERLYSSYSLTTPALDGGERSESRPGRALPPGKGSPVLIGQEAGWPQSRSGQRLEEKCHASAGERTSIARSSSRWSDTMLTELPRLHHVMLPHNTYTHTHTHTHTHIHTYIHIHTHTEICEISGSDGGEYKDDNLLR